MTREKTIETIVAREKDYFLATKNIGGRASCQNQEGNFIHARRSYWKIYSTEILKSYLEDLTWYEEKGLNPISLKYGYMMKSTSPRDYEKIRDRLLTIDLEKEKLVEAILLIYMTWEEDLDHKGARKLYTREDSLNETSVETYMRWELLTYSKKTLVLIAGYFMENLEKKNNLIRINLRALEETNKVNSRLGLESARKLAQKATREADRLGVPICLAIYDTGGNLMVFERQEGSILASIEIAQLKGKTALAFRTSTEDLSKNLDLASLNGLSTGKDQFCFLPGGAPLYREGRLFASIGISGGTIEEDLTILKKTLE